ncbi:MAG: TetR/AcrR family transcriptional regulator, partial [Acidimicrobiales bacterium]|nr:TetR/AcrR family transcriptional regulator [Acidimicrobiales bacterium]
MGTSTLSDTVRSLGVLTDSAASGTADDTSASLEQRILAATIRCVGRWGVGKTTLDDIAREAGCSRATIYRVLPGGKDKLLMAAGEHELCGFFARLAARLDQTDSLAEVLTVALSEAVRAVQHHEVLQYLLAHEPEVVLR